MRPRRNHYLSPLFVAYLIGVLALFFTLPRLLGDPYLMPWDYWLAFLIVTPTAAAGVLGVGVRAGWFSGWAVGLFYLAAVALGLALG